MAVEAGTQQEERIAHLARIREEGGPRSEAWCACRAADCAWHIPDPDTAPRGRARSAAGSVRCGGPLTLTVYADRAGRLWRIAEMCARCAAATPDCRVLDTAPPPARNTPGTVQAAGAPAAERRAPASGTAARGVPAVFSHGRSPAASTSSPAAPSASLPRARATSPGKASQRAKRWGKIAQRIVPHDLKPDALRVELIDLGDAFRAYQQRAEPDLVLLAVLHERKARAFRQWADVSGDGSLRHEAYRAEKAAQTTREMHINRGGLPDGDTADDGPVVERLLTRQQAVHARTVLDYVAAHAPYPEAEVHLAVLMLALRAARAGTGNVTSQDLTGWLPRDAERVLQQLVAADWLRLPGTVAEVMAARPEDPTVFTIPTLLPEQPRPRRGRRADLSAGSAWTGGPVPCTVPAAGAPRRRDSQPIPRRSDPPQTAGRPSAGRALPRARLARQCHEHVGPCAGGARRGRPGPGRRRDP